MRSPSNLYADGTRARRLALALSIRPAVDFLVEISAAVTSTTCRVATHALIHQTAPEEEKHRRPRLIWIRIDPSPPLHPSPRERFDTDVVSRTAGWSETLPRAFWLSRQD